MCSASGRTRAVIGEVTRSRGWYDCTQCNKSYTCVESLNKHVLLQHHSSESQSGESQSSDSVILLNDQSDKVHRCTVCMKEYADAHALRTHVGMKHSSRCESLFPCSACELSFLTLDKLRSHKLHVHSALRKVHARPDKPVTNERVHGVTLMQSEKTLHQCSYCEKTFSVRRELRAHRKTCDKVAANSIKSIESSGPNEKNGTGSTKRSRYRCKACGFFSNHHSAFRRHVENSSCSKSCNRVDAYGATKPAQLKDVLVSCENCSAQFYSKSGLEEHVRAKHKKKRNPFVCAECGEKFAYAENLVFHEKMHVDEKPFSCEKCGEKFSRLLLCIEHERTHLVKYSCSMCDESFESEQHVREHLPKHNRARQNYACNQCGEEFRHVENLLIHKKTHDDERPFACDKCGDRFDRVLNLMAHELSHASVRLVQLDSESSEHAVIGDWVPPDAGESDDGLYGCGLCGRMMDSSYAAKECFFCH